MLKQISIVAGLVAGSLSAVGAAGAVETTGTGVKKEDGYACTRGAYVRTVSVVQNPSADYACEVRYEKTSEGGGTNVLWNARNDASFCSKQAQKLTARLSEAGWACDAKGVSAAAGGDTSNGDGEPEAPRQDKAAAVDLPMPLSIAVAPGEGVTASIGSNPSQAGTAVPADAIIKKVDPKPAPANQSLARRGTIDPNDPALDAPEAVNVTTMFRPTME